MESVKENTIFSNKIYTEVTKWLFPTILVAFSFVGVNRGIDLTDTGYNMGNYIYLSKLDGMWYYSTLFSNFVGWLTVRLPFGATLLGANIYMGLIKASFGLFAYYYFTKRRGFTREPVFVAVFISFALWWIPNAGLYHYLSFYLLAAGTVLLCEGLFNDKRNCLFTAGVVLAANVFVRFPNVTNAGMIVALWLYCFLKKESVRECLSKTLRCIAGYVSTLVLVFGIIAACGKLPNYVTAIRELFAMTDDAPTYGPMFMVKNLVNSYTCVWYWLVPIALGLILLIAVSFLPEKFKPFGIAASVGGFALIYFWEYKKELFDYNFRSYSSIYLFMVVILIISMLLLVMGLFIKDLPIEVRTWCGAAIMIQLITPIGSNNSLYAVMNNMFFILPVSLYVLARLWKTKRFMYLTPGLWLFILLFLFQGICFRWVYVFRDGFLGDIDSRVYNNKTLAGMKTEAVNAAFLTELSDLWEKEGLKDHTVLAFGNNPGIAFVTGSAPAISSTWPILESYSSEKFATQLKMLEKRMEEGESVVVATDATLEIEGRKQEILKDFLQKYKFKSIYDKNDLKIWILEE
ncbi:MAG: hypothetical protein K6A74_02830 [Lachnospiraceae bacterium]|nr:hypothetical protein [Lachnospiraceae bacterium]